MTGRTAYVRVLYLMLSNSIVRVVYRRELLVCLIPTLLCAHALFPTTDTVELARLNS